MLKYVNIHFNATLYVRTCLLKRRHFQEIFTLNLLPMLQHQNKAATHENGGGNKKTTSAQHHITDTQSLKTHLKTHLRPAN